MRLAGSFSYDEESEATLKDLDLSVSQGDLIAVVGATGSGKSSLLSAALGLMEQQSGPEVELFGTVSFPFAFAFNINCVNRHLPCFSVKFKAHVL